jgi:hypothetical protein
MTALKLTIPWDPDPEMAAPSNNIPLDHARTMTAQAHGTQARLQRLPPHREVHQSEIATQHCQVGIQHRLS